jgi:hypothetical protein
MFIIFVCNIFVLIKLVIFTVDVCMNVSKCSWYWVTGTVHSE